MKHIKETIEITPEFNRSLDFYLPSQNYAVLDIETTGLSPVYSSVVLVGLIIVNDKEITMHQLFANTPGDEEEIISNTLKLISNISYLVTYNGRFFDVPFLVKRANKYEKEFPNLFNLDLFYLLKYYSDLPKFLPRMNQKTIEEYAGISSLRDDFISGEESVKLYNDYLESGSKELEAKILLHNSDDVKQLLRLLLLIKNVDIHRAFSKTGFPFKYGIITGIELKKKNLTIKGITDPTSDYIAFPSIEKPFHLNISKREKTFEIVLPCEEKSKSIYVDIGFLDESSKEGLTSLSGYVNDYFILINEGRKDNIGINLLSKEVATNALQIEW